MTAPSVHDQIAKALPKHLTVERMIRQTMTLVQMNPTLLECTPTSILRGVIQSSELGLELNGVLGQAYLVPRWNGKAGVHEATFQVGYKGLMALAFRSEKVLNIMPHVAHEMDLFYYQLGTSPRIDHKPSAHPRGEATHYYCVVQMVMGGIDFEVMSKPEIESHRAKYAPKKGFSPWDSSFDAMALKTVIRRIAKRLPVSVECQNAAAIDEYNEAGVDTQPPMLVSNPSKTEQLEDKLDELVGAQELEMDEAGVIPPMPAR